MMEIALILAAFFVGTIFGGAAAWTREECPREIRGYNCRGIECNHSRMAVMQAHKDMQHDDHDQTPVDENPNFWKGDDK